MPAVFADGDVLPGQAQHHRLGVLRYERFGFRLAEQLPAAGELGGAVAIGEQPVVAQPGETVRQHMQEKPADEFVGIELHDLDLVAVRVVAPAEADVLAVEIDETVVGDRRLVRVAPEVAQHLAGVRERCFGVDDPIPGPQRGCQMREGVIVVTVGIGAELAIATRRGEKVEILPTEDLRQRPGWEQEAFPGRGEPAILVRAQAAIGDDAVDMDVLSEILSPGVQHHGDAEFTAEPAGIVAEFEQGAGRGLEEQLVDGGGVRLGERIEFVRQREHHVPVADVEQVGALLLDPLGLCERLALGAVPVPARGILDRHRAAFVALGLEAAERGCATVYQVVHDPVLLRQQRMRRAIVIGACAQDVGHLQRPAHGTHFVLDLLIPLC